MAQEKTATPASFSGFLSGMRGFTVVWFGQIVSFIGTGITRFALTIWAWDITGEATALALVAFFSFAPIVILSPVAGALVDRWNRKLVMMLSDLAAGLSTIAILLLYATGNLEIWHLYVAGAFAGAFESFQFPAYSAAVTMMIPKKQYARASGMLSLAESGAGIFAPILAGMIIGFSGGIERGMVIILLLDIITFLAALFALAIVHIPQPPNTESGQEGRGSLLKESVYGFHYIFNRPSLFGLQLVFFGINLIATFAMIVLAPMILARTDNNAALLGVVQSAGAIGGLCGGLLLSTWGGPKRKVHGVLMGMMMAGLLGEFLMGLGSGPVIWIIAAFFGAFFIPILNGSNQAIWQAKVAPNVQGRVFAARRLIAQITAPVAMLIAGPVADYIFEPALMPWGTLAPVFGGLVGIGPGSGMSLMFILAGLAAIFVAGGAYFFPAIRNAEDILPDHDVATGVETSSPPVETTNKATTEAPNSISTTPTTPAGTSLYKSRRRHQIELAWGIANHEPP